MRRSRLMVLGMLSRISSLSPAARLLTKIASNRVDFVGIGDSNQLFGAHGWDHGFQYALSQYYSMYATGLISAMETSGTGVGKGYKYAYSDQTNIGTGAGAPADLDKYMPANNAGNPTYGYLDDTGSVATFNGTGLELASDCLLDVNANLTFRFHFGTFPTGTGSNTFHIRRNNSPYTTLATLANDPVTGAYGMQSADITIAAATRNYPILASWHQVGQTIQGPCFFTYIHAINADRAAGWAYSTLVPHGGASLRRLALDVQELGDDGLTHFFSILRARQGSSKNVCIVINSGLNDRNEANTSVGPAAVTDGNSAEAYADNLTAIVETIEDVWTLNGWDLDELVFLVMPSHPVASPDDAELISYRAAVATFAAARDNVDTIDLTTLTSYTELTANNWYNSGIDQMHLKQAAYEALGLRVIDALR